ncbi:MAG: hypothetical protein V1836_03850 [Candidatus Aenigmatarchaeota archaeon]
MIDCFLYSRSFSAQRGKMGYPTNAILAAYDRELEKRWFSLSSSLADVVYRRQTYILTNGSESESSFYQESGQLSSINEGQDYYFLARFSDMQAIIRPGRRIEKYVPETEILFLTDNKWLMNDAVALLEGCLPPYVVLGEPTHLKHSVVKNDLTIELSELGSIKKFKFG